jgi:hypothetical protein
MKDEFSSDQYGTGRTVPVDQEGYSAKISSEISRRSSAQRHYFRHSK